MLVQVNRVILGRLLQSFGFDVCYSKDGLEAFEFFKEQGTDISCVWMVRLCLIPTFRAVHPIHLVIVDINGLKGPITGSWRLRVQDCHISISCLVYIWGKDLTFWQLLLFVQGWVPLV